MTDYTSATTSPTATPPPAAPRRWRALRWVLALLAVLLLLPVGAWWWASSEGSLPRALQLAQKFLPDGQSLLFSDAQGSITGGGRIGQLQWSMPGVAVTIDDLRLEWSLRQLFGRALHVRTLHAGNVHVRLTPQPDESPPEPFTMPADVSLPIDVTLPLTIARLQIETVDADGDSSTQVIDDLAAHYRYDGTLHALRLDSLRHDQSHVQADLQLHAQDLTLGAQIGASLRDLVPDTPFAMLVRLRADGSLAGGEEARLDLRLDARQQPHDAPPLDARNLLAELATLRTTLESNGSDDSAAEAGAQVHAQATVHPWRQQPAQQVDLQLSRLDARAFHGEAPVTALRGHASLQPVAAAASAWDLVLDLTNEQPGAWDGQYLPLRTLTARAWLSAQQLDIETAQAELGGASSAGSVILTGVIPLQQPGQSTLRLDLQQLDLHPLMADLPRTAFDGQLAIDPLPDAAGWQAQADIRNTVPGPLDRDRVPLDRVLAELRVTPELWRAETLQVQVGTGRAQLQGQFEPQTQVLDLRGTLQRLPLRQIHGELATGLASELSGTLAVGGNLQQRVTFDADITSNAADSGDEAAQQRGQWEIRAVQAKGEWSPTRLTIERIHVDAFEARVDGSDIDVVLPGLDSIAARVTASAPGVTLEADAAMLQQSGEGSLSLQLASAEQVVIWLQGLPVIGERLPDLRASGSGSLLADWQGGWQQWADGIENPAAHPQLRLNAAVQAQALRIELPAADGASPTQLDVDSLAVDVQGNLASASLAVDADARANGTHALLDVRMQMTQTAGDAGAPLWNVTVEQFAAAATLPDQSQPWRLQVAEGLQIAAQTGDDFELRASAGRAALSPPSGVATGDAALELAWEPMLWRQAADGGATVQSVGTISGIQPAWLDALLAPEGEGPLAVAGMRTDLVVSGGWDIQMTDRLDIRAHLQRDSGDVWLLDPGIAAGMRTFNVQVQSEGDDVALALDWDTERAGVITAQVSTRLDRQAGGWLLPETAPLSGTVQARLQDLGAWGFLAPPGWRVQGALDAGITLGGTVQAPQLQGSIEGRRLNIRSVLDGVDLHDGVLRATLEGDRLQIAELTLQGGTGSRAYVRGLSGNRTQPPTDRGRMTASGTIDWSGVASAGAQEGSGIAMDLRAELQRMQVLVRNDRQMSLSGDLSANLQQGALRVRGDIRVDRASIMLPDAGAPTLGDDVVVVRASDLQNGAAPEPRGQLQTAMPMDVEIRLDLGRDLALQGHGITTRLEGALTVRSTTSGNDPFSVVGEVRTDEGRYRAWGQALNVETGVVLFNGPYANPSLNLLAIRPEIAVRAGVRVTGTLAAPRVQLYSEPDMPEAEKLSWVVLGRATATSGAEGTSMQQAALGLLAGGVGSSLAGGLGLDELGLGESSVSVGKRLSDELYVTYEAGFFGAASTLYIFYDITRRFTVRGQTGEASAVDLIYTISYD